MLDEDGNIDRSLNRWDVFKRRINELNAGASGRESYKGVPSALSADLVLFLARHGEGWHNVAEAFYGTAAWDCYWAEENGNGTITWVYPFVRLSHVGDRMRCLRRKG